MKKPKVIELKRPPVPDEYCPECLSLKRKPNKECVNHEKYWIKKNEPSAMHNIIIEKYRGKYEIRCVGSYADLVRGRNTDYELSARVKTLEEARGWAGLREKMIIFDYERKGKKAYVKIIENI